MGTPSTASYAFSNTSPQAPAHHSALARQFDPLSIHRTRGLLSLRGKHCLEVGAGGGSFAGWMATEVGEDGSVLATDLEPAQIPAHPRMTVLAHDITRPLPEGGWDFVHARLLLNHLPARRDVLARLARALSPGGVLLVEDFDPLPPDRMVAYAPSDEDASLLGRYQRASSAVLARHGSDATWSTRAHGAMIAAGLTDVRTTVWAESWRGGGGGCQLLAASCIGHRSAELVEAGLSAAELDRIRHLLSDPEVVLHGHRLVSTSGCRPV